MNGPQQRQHGQAVQRLHDRLDTLAECVDMEVGEKMTQIRALVTRVNGETRAYADLQLQDVRIDTDRQLEALTKRVAAFEKMTMLQMIRRFFTAEPW